MWGWLSCWSFKYVFYTWVKRCNYILARSLSYADWFSKFFSVTDSELSSWAWLFLNTELSFGCGQIFTKHSTANFLLNLPVKYSRNWSHLANYYHHHHYYHIVHWNCCMTPVHGTSPQISRCLVKSDGAIWRTFPAVVGSHLSEVSIWHQSAQLQTRRLVNESCMRTWDVCMSIGRWRNVASR